jgi:hypothetical protein
MITFGTALGASHGKFAAQGTYTPGKEDARASRGALTREA